MRLLGLFTIVWVTYGSMNDPWTAESLKHLQSLSTYDSWNTGALSKTCRQLNLLKNLQAICPESAPSVVTCLVCSLGEDLVKLTSFCFPRHTSVYFLSQHSRMECFSSEEMDT